MKNISDHLDLRTEGNRLLAYTPLIACPKTISRVRQALKSRTLTLVFGAGVSDGLGLPLWDELIKTLYKSTYRKMSSRLKPSSIMRLRKKGKTTNAAMIRHLENMMHFRSTVRSALQDRLYEKYKPSGAQRLIVPICRMFLLKRLRYRVQHVITYNFDNAMEQTLRLLKCSDVYTIYSAESYPLQHGGLRIYHPHGFLPPKKDDPDGSISENEVVFSEREYNLHCMDASHWANVLQLHHFMNRVCLFVGLSMTDPNLRRLLDHAHERTKGGVRHAAIQKTTGDTLTDAYLETDLASLGVATIWVKKHADIPSVLKECSKTR